MIFENPEEVIKLLKDNLTPTKWVLKSRETHKTLNALVTGKNFSDVLINKIEKIESNARKVARKNYSKDIRDLFDRVMQPRSNVFSSSGGSTINNLEGEVREKVIEVLNNFKGQKTIKQYLANNLFQLEDIDPNGLLFMEYESDIDIYPTYKSINDIRNYKSNGQLLEWVIFEPKTIIVNNTSIMEWRVVDDRNDYTFQQIGSSFILAEHKTFAHPFTNVPAVILSDIQEIGSEVRISPINPIQKLSEDYARDKSIRTIYKFQNGFPKHWRYEAFCRPCQGTGKSNDGKGCTTCKGSGKARNNDVTDTTTLNFPREGQPVVTPNLEGFSSPDLETWGQYNSDLRDMEELIESTMWGTRRVDKGANETATGRFIDTQPVTNKIDQFADNYEWVSNALIGFVEDWENGEPKEEKGVTLITGRRFIIESSDVLLDKYTDSVSKGVNSSVLDKLLEEFIYSKYQNNAHLLNMMLVKKDVEPYVHLDIKDVNAMFGREEADRKQSFVNFWEQADVTKDRKELIEDFDIYFSSNKLSPIKLETLNN